MGTDVVTPWPALFRPALFYLRKQPQDEGPIFECSNECWNPVLPRAPRRVNQIRRRGVSGVTPLSGYLCGPKAVPSGEGRALRAFAMGRHGNSRAQVTARELEGHGVAPSPLRGSRRLKGTRFPGFRSSSAAADDKLHPGLFSRHPSGMPLPTRRRGDFSVLRQTLKADSFCRLCGTSKLVP
jgi:hypothetical protein